MDVPREPGLFRRTLRFARRPMVVLILLTLLGAVLRLSSLGRPTVWGDEGMTWSRVCGSWQDLTEVLRDRGLFMPGHYMITWWIKEGFPVWGSFTGSETIPVGAFGSEPTPVEHTFIPSHRLAGGPIALTPFWLRLVPALCGIGMIPATYFLAVQLVSRRTALLAALFAATSAYILAYSRDAKMYVQFWFFATLCNACLLWWLDLRRINERDFTPRSPLRWLSWIASGCAMTFFHALGLLILLPQLLLVLTAPRTGPFHAVMELVRRARGKPAIEQQGVTNDSVALTPASPAAVPYEPALVPVMVVKRTRSPLASVLVCLVPAVVWFALGAVVIGLPAYNWFRHFNEKDDVVKPHAAEVEVTPRGAAGTSRA
ncbi:MAG: phospholipid carrier-dependent glycosyltransferase [Tepidisphaeraceae bacterium]